LPNANDVLGQNTQATQMLVDLRTEVLSLSEKHLEQSKRVQESLSQGLAEDYLTKYLNTMASIEMEFALLTLQHVIRRIDLELDRLFRLVRLSLPADHGSSTS
jgi:hypothetical protein